MKDFSKKICAVALAAGMTASAIPMAMAEGVKKYKGDVDLDGAVTSKDALEILVDSISGEESKLDLVFADMNGDEQANSADALMVLQTVVGQLELVEIDPEDPEDPPEEDPVLSYTKEQIVQFYTDSLKNSYNQKVTIDKKENTDIVVDTLSPSSLKTTVNNLIKNNAKVESKKETITTPSYCETFLVPAKLEGDGAKDAKVTKTENGYKVEITLVEEKVDHLTAPKFNTQASNPVTGIKEILQDVGAKVNKIEFDYKGTVIVAEIDANNRVTSLSHKMPMNFSVDVKVSLISAKGTGHGTYSLDAKLTY